jgi:hypothetical protein
LLLADTLSLGIGKESVMGGSISLGPFKDFLSFLFKLLGRQGLVFGNGVESVLLVLRRGKIGILGSRFALRAVAEELIEHFF